LNSTDGGVSWNRQGEGLSSENLNSIFFLNREKGWAVGDNGTVLMTSDGGNVWERVLPCMFASNIRLNDIKVSIIR
jgi:photosystem II stability/assembly factor-like uncharacterized protein